MFAHLRPFVRAVLVASALVSADARPLTARPPPTPRAAVRPPPAEAHAPQQPGDDDMLTGALLVAGVLGVVVALAWACSRVSDSRPPD